MRKELLTLTPFRKFFSNPLPNKLLLFEAVSFLFLARMMLLILPFRVCIRTLKTVKNDNSPEIGQIKTLKYAIDRADRFAFWENTCLGRSIAGRWMLQRRSIKSALMIGVRHDDKKNLKAHAWLTVGEFEFVPRMDNFTVITTY